LFFDILTLYFKSIKRQESDRHYILNLAIV